MRCVFVRHFLNKAGLEYFENTWFPAVQAAICVQPGFIAIVADKDETQEMVRIKVSFRDVATLEAWVKTERHDELVDNLDDFRIRDWEWAATDVSEAQHIDFSSSELDWQHAIPKNVVYSRLNYK